MAFITARAYVTLTPGCSVRPGGAVVCKCLYVLLLEPGSTVDDLKDAVRSGLKLDFATDVPRENMVAFKFGPPREHMSWYTPINEDIALDFEVYTISDAVSAS